MAVEHHAVVFTPEAAEQLLALEEYIAHAASPTVAARYADAIVATCEKLALFPQRGTPRDDIRPGLRLIHHRRRTVIAYAVLHGRVSIIGLFYGGQDFSRLTQTDIDDQA